MSEKTVPLPVQLFRELVGPCDNDSDIKLLRVIVPLSATDDRLYRGFSKSAHISARTEKDSALLMEGLPKISYHATKLIRNFIRDNRAEMQKTAAEYYQQQERERSKAAQRLVEQEQLIANNQLILSRLVGQAGMEEIVKMIEEQIAGFITTRDELVAAIEKRKNKGSVEEPDDEEVVAEAQKEEEKTKAKK